MRMRRSWAATEKSLAKANKALDTLTRDEGMRDKLDPKVLGACVAKQDPTPIKQSMEAATALGVDSTPALFINGDEGGGRVAAGGCVPDCGRRAGRRGADAATAGEA